MSPTVQARLFKGVKDVLPEELLARNQLMQTLVAVFERYGFGPLETPAMEYLDILLGKYGTEGDKLIYKLAYKGGETLALRYDLTVPLSRVVAMNPDLPMPFKRWQVQPVWRADRAQPAQGRFREFIQCDVDTVGTASLAADAENVAVVHDGIRALGIDDFLVRINNRKLLAGIREWAGIAPAQEADLFRSIDKLDKIGLDGVRAELAKLDLPAEPVEKVLGVMEITGAPEEVLARAEATLAGSERAAEGVSELRELLEGVAALGVALDRMQIDLYLTRGLDYYTGPIYEVNLTSIEKFGSLAGGGRYDDLAGVYGNATVPATGVSIGLSRVLSALRKLDLLKSRTTTSQVLVARLEDTPIAECLRICSELRAGGIACETYYDPDRLKKQFQLAERKGIPIVALAGASELAAGTVNLKHLARSEQVTVPRAEFVQKAAALLSS